MKLSIIVPVYNAEKFLYKCLGSICNQNLSSSDYEVIVINDGSTDRSALIILEFQKNAENLICINQENKGVSVARNAGLQIAKGEYITFVDSDDQIKPLSLVHLLNYATKLKLDILYGAIENVDENGKHIIFQEQIGERNIVKKGFIHPRRTYPATFYRNEIVKNIKFNPEISFGEDTVFNAMAQAFSQRVSFLDVPYYQYTIRANSLSKQGNSEKAFLGFLKAIFEIRNFQRQNFNNVDEANIYFDKIFEIFVTRIIEINIIPHWDRKKYEHLAGLLLKNDLFYTLNILSTKYPFVAISFNQFKLYQQYLVFKSKIYKIIKRA